MRSVEAIEYEAIGFEDIAPTTWIDPNIKVESFLSLYLEKENFCKVVIINSGYKYLRNWNKFTKNNQEEFFEINTIEDGSKFKDQIKLACISHGHMSVMFFGKNTSMFLDNYLKLGYFKYKNRISMGTGERGDPLAKDQVKVFFKAINLYLNLQIDQYACLFSHDADQLFKIEDRRGD